MVVGDNNLYSRIFNMVLFDIMHPDMDLIAIYFQYLKNKISPKFLKESGYFDLSSEAFFWERSFHEWHIKDPNNPPCGKRALETKESISFALECIEKDFRPPYRCIEVGCGPTSQFYTDNLKDRTDVEIITVDPLSETYKNLHLKYNTNYNISCITGYGEKLNELFPEKHFHLVYSQNAIDHSSSPKKFIDNLYHITVTGGYLIIYGFVNEGSAAKWLGLHQWNIEVENGHLLRSNRDKSIFKENMTRHLNMDLVYADVTGSNIGDKYTLIYKKNKL